MRTLLLLALLAAPVAGCSPAPVEPSEAPAPPPAPSPPPLRAPLAAPAGPLGFAAFSVSPAPPVRWTDRFEAKARLLEGVSVYTDLHYRWTVNGQLVRGWSREFLRVQEGRWRVGDRVTVQAIASDETGRVAETERLEILLGEEGERRERPSPPPPVDWDALRRADARPETPAPPERPRERDPEEEEARDPGLDGYYVNPLLNQRPYDVMVPPPRPGVVLGPDQEVDGWSPGEPRVDGWSPGEPRVDGWSPGEPRVGR